MTKGVGKSIKTSFFGFIAVLNAICEGERLHHLGHAMHPVRRRKVLAHLGLYHGSGQSSNGPEI